MPIKWYQTFFLCILLTFTACFGNSNSESSASSDTQPLQGTSWVLDQLNGNELIPDSEITLQFSEDEISGSAGCNTYNAEYEAGSDGSLSIPEVARTAMDCPSPEGILDQEAAYLEALWTAATYQITNDKLEIRNGEDTVTLIFSKG